VGSFPIASEDMTAVINAPERFEKRDKQRITAFSQILLLVSRKGGLEMIRELRWLRATG
jgi:hypothetical protein